MSNLHSTIENITYGLNVQNEAAILPVYYDGELYNRAAFNAYRFKRIAGSAGRFASRAGGGIARFADHLANHNGCQNFPYCEQ